MMYNVRLAVITNRSTLILKIFSTYVNPVEGIPYGDT